VTSAIDYEKRIWGHHTVKLSPWSFNALRLRYALLDLASVKGKVLDVGCGGGSMSDALRAGRPDLNFYGCDISYWALSEAEKRVADAGFAQGDGYKLPYATHEFQAVVMFDVLEHLEMPEEAISEVERVLAPGGIFHLAIPCEGNPLTIQGGLTSMGSKLLEHSFGHVQAFGIRDLTNLLEAQGFRIEAKRWGGHIISQIAHTAYAAYLALRREESSNSIESQLEHTYSGVRRTGLSLLKAMISSLMFYESKLLWRFPGALVHLTCRRQHENDEVRTARRADCFRNPLDLHEPWQAEPSTFQVELPRQ
jgi:ubiquinone/menaquinone biosynthesis C-methylase UbiE